MTMYLPGIDGLSPVGSPPSDDCCPPDICSITEDALACNFVNLLPRGPLWDREKQKAISCAKTWCDDQCPPDNECSSVVSYAAYVGRVLYAAINGALWPAIRESSPYTAYDTMDEWLTRLGWADCYNSNCRPRDLGKLSPYEIMGECGPQYCPPSFPDDLSLVYKRGVIVALWRMRHGIRRNIAGINFILEKLYAELIPDPDYNPAFPESRPCLILRPTADFGAKIVPEACPRDDRSIAEQNKVVQLYLTPGHGVCVGAPDRVYPTVLAAHCIVRSLLPSCNLFCLKRTP